MSRRHRERFEDKSGANETSVRVHTKRQGQTDKIYSRRKQKQGTSSELVKESTAAAEFPTTVWGTF